MDYRVITEGMGCQHCVARVTKAVTGLGAEIRKMELNDFTVAFSGDKEAIRKAVEALGFKVVSIQEA